MNVKKTKKKKTVLIIEDEEMILRALRITLEDQFEIISAVNGAEGFEMIKEHMPDVVLLDIVLPGMSGFEILEKTKADPVTKDIIFVVLSNLGQDQDVARGIKLGAVAYFIKTDLRVKDIPIKLMELCS